MADAKYPNHLYKGEIDKRIDNGDSCRSIYKWLKSFNDPNIYLSMPTLSKIKSRRQASSTNLQPKTAIKVGVSKELDKKIRKLWDTVKICDDLERKMDKRITITSIKDWQYINQQKQDALKLIAELQGEKSIGGDISMILARIFSKMEDTDKKVSEEEAMDVIVESLKGDEPKPI